MLRFKAAGNLATGVPRKPSERTCSVLRPIFTRMGHMTSELGGLAPFFRRFLSLLNGYTPFFQPYFGHFWPPVNGFLSSPSGWDCSDFTNLAMDTLVSLAGQFPLLGPVRDLHPLADIHASQTTKKWQVGTSALAYHFFCFRVATVSRCLPVRGHRPTAIDGYFCFILS